MAVTPRNPLVLTLTLDKSTQNFLTTLRSKYFPSHRNFLQAHVTLFHAIPPQRFPEVDEELARLCASTNPWEVFVNDPRKMGNRGVMVSVRDRRQSIEWIHRRILNFLKDGVKEPKDELTEQDKRHWGKTAHVTILNKAEKEEEVQLCLDEVTELFEGMKGPDDKFGQKVGSAIGLQIWEYKGGPWDPIKQYHFKDAQEKDAEAP